MSQDDHIKSLKERALLGDRQAVLELADIASGERSRKTKKAEKKEKTEERKTGRRGPKPGLPQRGGIPRTLEQWAPKFLEYLKEEPNYSRAARLAGVSLSAVKKWRNKDKGFAAACEEAVEEAVNDLEGHAWRLAKGIVIKRRKTNPDGSSEDVVQVVQKPNVRITLRLLEAHRPEIYARGTYAKMTDGAISKSDKETERDVREGLSKLSVETLKRLSSELLTGGEGGENTGD